MVVLLWVPVGLTIVVRVWVEVNEPDPVGRTVVVDDGATIVLLSVDETVEDEREVLDVVEPVDELELGMKPLHRPPLHVLKAHC